MHIEPKYPPYTESHFFDDHRSERPMVEDTVPRGSLRVDVARFSGKIDGADITYFPIPIARADLERGMDRFNIYCSPCHSRIGDGNGLIVMRGMVQPPSYHTPRLREAPVGHFFDVITNGYGAMLNYAQQIEPRDRWAIVAYIRVLQYSENANINDLPMEARNRLPQAGQAEPERLKAAELDEPIAPPDADLTNFPNEPATPSGVPGVFGAGARPGKQPERK